MCLAGTLNPKGFSDGPDDVSDLGDIHERRGGSPGRSPLTEAGVIIPVRSKRSLEVWRTSVDPLSWPGTKGGERSGPPIPGRRVKRELCR